MRFLSLFTTKGATVHVLVMFLTACKSKLPGCIFLLKILSEESFVGAQKE
jgi:hypothetical protein